MKLPLSWRVTTLETWWGPRYTSAPWYAKPFAWFQMWHEQPALHFRLPCYPWPLLDLNLLGVLRLTTWLPGFIKVQAGKLSGMTKAWRVEAYGGCKYDATENDWLLSVSARARTQQDVSPDPRGMA